MWSAVTPFNPTGQNYCYKHPDRLAGVGCQRCNRPICPSCMNSAAVGFHCPHCVEEMAGPQRLLNTAIRRSQPRLTYVLIGINVAVFLVDLVLGSKFGSATGSGYRTMVEAFGLYGGNPRGSEGVAAGEWWRIITGGFLHAGLWHLGFNMYALNIVGTVVERRVGSLRFGLMYFAALLGGSFGALLVSPDALTVGASGAIFGLFGMMVFLQMSAGVNPLQGGIGPTILLNLVITVMFASYISVGGHVGGLVVGALVGFIAYGASPEQARQRHSAAQAINVLIGGIAVALAIGCVVLARVF